MADVSQYPDSAQLRNPEQSVKRKPIDVALVRRCIEYNPKTGGLFWKPRSMDMFQSVRVGRGWNTKFAGKSACSTSMQGYKTVCLYDERFLAHRIAWAIYYGDEPPEILDHINRDRTDNRIVNLRPVTSLQNGRNQSVRVN